MSVQVGKLYKNKKVKDMSGNIIDWYDEVNGGWIIKSRQIVNKERWEEEVKKEKDKLEAAKAVTKTRTATPQEIALRNGEKIEEVKKENSKVDELEKKVENIDKKMDKILEALSK